MPIIKGPFRLFVYDLINNKFKIYISKTIQVVRYNQYTPFEKDHYYCTVEDDHKSSFKIKYEVNRNENKIFTNNTKYITMITRETDINGGTRRFAEEITKHYTEEINYMELEISKINDMIKQYTDLIDAVRTTLKVEMNNELGE